MALTNFAAMTTEQKTAWAKDLMRVARNSSFVMKFAGSGPNSVIHRVKELKKSEKGARAVITLVPDLEGAGVMGDYELESNEEQIKAFDQVIRIDQIRNANRIAGRMADQKSIVNFRETSRDVLGYWIGDIIDQLAFLTLSGVDYTKKPNGADWPVLATGRNLSDLEFAADVTAPSANRHFRWDGTNGQLVAGDTTTMTTDDTPSYKMLVEMRAMARDLYIRGVRGEGNTELYHVFLSPKALAKLKMDPDYLANVRSAGTRGSSNTLFKGGIETVDGLVLHDFRHVFNTGRAAAGDQWGGAGDVDGCRVLMLGAQALGMADLGVPYWEERNHFDYGNQLGISVGKILGFLKPQFHSNATGTVEDFGVMCVDVAQ